MKENSIGDRIEEKYTRYLNCETDTLELTIEEAIFILETDASLHYVEDLLQEAYKVILSDYKRVLKENEELKRKNKTLEELLQGNLYELYKYYKELAGTYQGNCILKEKIKNKIEYLKDYIEENSDEQGYWGNINSDIIYGKIEILEESLEESED